MFSGFGGFQSQAAPPSGVWTAASKGDADGSVTENSVTSLEISASGTNDSANIDYAYQTVTSGDVQIVAYLPDNRSGYSENFTGFGVGITEGTGDSAYWVQVWLPDTGVVRRKWGPSGAAESGLAATSQPRWVALTYDHSAGELKGWESANGTIWTQVGSTLSKTLTYNVLPYVFGTSHDAAQTSTATLTNVALTDTITIGASPVPDADFVIELTDTLFDGNVEGVVAGDVIEIEAGTRAPLRIRNVEGEALNPVTIRSDPAGKTTIRNTSASNSWPFRLTDCKHFVLDASYTTGETYGIFITSTVSNDDVEHYLRLDGECTNYTARYIEVDGDYPTTSIGGTGIAMNDQNVLDTDLAWREDVLIEFCKVANVHGEAMYIGPNWGKSGVPWNRTPLRNIEIANNTLLNAGRDAIQVKSTIEGTNQIHHNYIHTTGIRSGETIAGQKHGISYFEGSGDAYNNIVIDAGEHGVVCTMSNRPDNPMPAFRTWNNLIVNSGWHTDAIAQTGKGISQGVKSGSGRPSSFLSYNNTIVDSEGNGISIASNFDNDVTIQNNIVCGSGSSAISNSGSGSETISNNETGSTASQNFADTGSDDYHLTVSSPAVEAATTGTVAATDLDDVDRPAGADECQGAYEYVA